MADAAASWRRKEGAPAPPPAQSFAGAAGRGAAATHNPPPSLVRLGGRGGGSSGGGGGNRGSHGGTQRASGPAAPMPSLIAAGHQGSQSAPSPPRRGGRGGGRGGGGGNAKPAAPVEYKLEIDANDTRRLLILDINGVLVCREPFKKRDQPRGYVRRPHCDKFLDWAFEHFQVGVWSCGRLENMEMELFDNRKLVFVFSQDNSVNLWPRHSVVAPEKPLFLKDLSNVWEHSGGVFSMENTILLDNHDEKFERNPPGTCVLVSEYSQANDNDDALSLTGALVTHLTAMKTRELADYAREQADLGNAMFAFINRKPADLASSAPVVADQLALRRELATVFTSSEMMRRNCPERDVGFYMRHHDTPGPRATPMRRRELARIAKAPVDKWTVCEKTDGVRSLLFIPKDSSHAWFVDRSWNFTRAFDLSLDASLSPSALLRPCDSGASLLDGEVVQGKEGWGYVCFDVAFLFGKDLGSMPKLTERMRLLKETLSGQTHVRQGAFTMVLKEFRSLSELRQFEAPTWNYGRGIGEVACDGLVFSPQVSYYEMTVIKYKSAESLTVDFRVSVPQNISVGDELSLFLTMDRAKHSGIASLLVDNEFNRQQLLRFARSEVTVECAFDAKLSLWRLSKTRPDKSKSNSLSTAWAVLESLAENLCFEDLVNAFLNSPVPPQEVVSNVAAHYDARQKERNEGADPDARIAALRRLNNTIKQFLIGAPPRCFLPCSPRPCPLPTALAQRRAASSAASSRKSAEAAADGGGGPFRILDVACGRGGDLGKWFNFYKVDEYVGVDISSVALAEAQQRVQSMHAKHMPKKKTFICADAGDGSLPEKLSMASTGPRFDIVSCQFAMHYFCASRAACVSFLRDMAAVTRPGAWLLATLLDGDAVDAALGPEGVSWRNSVCVVDLVKRGEGPGSWGRTVRFTLGDAVVGLEEPLVPTAGLQSAAEEAGFTLVGAVNFARLVEDELTKPASAFLNLAIAMKVLDERPVSADEWAASALYRGVCLVRNA